MSVPGTSETFHLLVLVRYREQSGHLGCRLENGLHKSLIPSSDPTPLPHFVRVSALRASSDFDIQAEQIRSGTIKTNHSHTDVAVSVE
jgi:hypothetical protein